MPSTLNVLYLGMVEIKEALHGNVVLTIKDRKGNVLVHETVKAQDVEIIIERNAR